MISRKSVSTMDNDPLIFNQGDSLEAGSDSADVHVEKPIVVATEPNEPSEPIAVAEPTDSTSQPEIAVEKPFDANGNMPKDSKLNQATLAFRHLFKRFNLYMLLFCVVLLAGGIVFAVAVFTNKNDTTNTVNTQSLSDSTLKQLANSDVSVGQPKQTLNVQSNAVFAGKVLIHDSLEVVGAIRVGGALSIPGITVSGSSIFDQVQVNKSLNIAGDSAFQGQISTQKNLSVAGGGTFGGALSAPQISVNTLQLNGDLNLNRHITIGGATPSRTNGSALGSGGTASVSGSDSAGSVNINTGNGASVGCFLTVNFAQKFNATPHVLITPVGSEAASFGYYVTRNTTSFTICAANTPPSSASFGFDYFVLD